MDKIGRIKKKVILISISLSIIALFSFGIYFLITANIVVSPPKLVDWTKHKVIVFESDDWGMCGWVPDMTTFNNLTKDTFIKEVENNSLRYALSTLESPEDLERLFKILEKYKGGDDRHPIFQPNYIMSSPNFEKIMENGYKSYFDLIIPDVPSLWKRGDFITKAREGIKREIWYPEYHGNTHFNSFKWMLLLKSGDLFTIEALNHQVAINGNVNDNNEYDSSQPYKQQKGSVNAGIHRFYKIFGYYPHSSMAPNYYWQIKTEKALSTEGIRVIQAKNSQHTNRSLNILGKKSSDKIWRIAVGDYNPSLNLYYLNRNVDFEPRGKSDSETDMGAEEAYKKIIEAWEKNEPAIVNTHRINYVYLKPEFVEENLKQLEWLLHKIQTEQSDAVYLTDWEVAQLYEDGTSVLHFGNDIVCRNFTNINQLFKVDIPEHKKFNAVYVLPENKLLSFTSSGKDIIFTVPAGKTCVVELVNEE